MGASMATATDPAGAGPDPVPDPEDALEWRMLTMFPVQDFADARLVVMGYTQRWRVEQFPRAWKSGQCGVEKTQLCSKEAVMK
jgi:hypothetical protein